MSKKLDYRVLSEYCLVIEVLSGKVELDDYISFKEAEIHDNQYNINYKHIVDLCDAIIVTEGENLEEKVKKFVSTIKNTAGFFGNRKSALLASTPRQVTATMLYKLLNDLPVPLQTFTTLSAAIEWLELAYVDTNYIKAVILEMKKHGQAVGQ